MENNQVKLFIVDDHKMFLEGITSILNTFENIIVLGTAKNGEEALKLLPNFMPDVLITDIDMPQIDGIELTQKVKSLHPNVRIIAVSSHYKSSVISKAIQAGIDGYILKNTGKLELYKAIESVYNKEKYFTNEVKEIINNSIFNVKKTKENKVNLSDREKEVLIHISNEKSSQEIAEILSLSVYTIETHRKNLMRKIGTKNVVGLVKYAIQQGIV
ncbi:response regulator transcription factor [Flaviramulus sp. BrNp1-15]|uniref:response regulator transcription factor n=1 Tax=Flaviramulus sp. BrNp1-15 TaxID=2916754 RepID=UPI001EE7FF86|nr:response regulator transcription factor [Flaviramulus sp. BrNp1-15]ULC58176.1 response regulator transcription factor [Flaviramulus sp. BrNp1-15]